MSEETLHLELRAFPRTWRGYNVHYNRSPGHTYQLRLVQGASSRKIDGYDYPQSARADGEYTAGAFGLPLIDRIDNDIKEKPNDRP